MKSTIKYVAITAVMLGAFFTVAPKAEAATTIRAAAMASANTQKGAPYVWGHEGPYSQGYDCSGLTFWAYKKHNKILPRTAAGQWNASKHISVGARQPGDLVFFFGADHKVFHVGIYTGMKNGHEMMTDANSGPYRGYKVVTNAPVYEFTGGKPYRAFGRIYG